MSVAGLLALSFNCGLRTVYPSQYVPYQQTCDSLYCSPFFARSVATMAEFYFYREIAASANLRRLWTGNRQFLFQLWVVGECVSWTGLLMQNSMLNASEDVIWFVWYMICYVSTKQIDIEHLVALILSFYIAWHLPKLLCNDEPIDDVVILAPKLSSHGDWVVPSVQAEIVVYLGLYIRELLRLEKSQSGHPHHIESRL